MNIYDELVKPFFVLAPMEGVTDSVFRRLVHETAPADLYVTEFTNATSYVHPKGRASTESRLHVEAGEGPVVAQLWGTNTDDIREAARNLSSMQPFVGIDLNFGCPDRGIRKQGACSALIGNQQIVREIVKAVRDCGLPLSLKTRLGQGSIDWEWIEFVLGLQLPAVTFHLRTVKEMSKVAAHWEIMSEISALRDQVAPNTILIGNGDVIDRQHGLQLAKEHNIEGVMIGRGIFHDISAFASHPKKHSPEEKCKLLLRHLQLWEQNPYPGAFAALKRFFKVYISDYPGAHELRARLMECQDIHQVRAILGA